MIRTYEFDIIEFRRTLNDAIEELVTKSIADIVYMKVCDELENFLYEHEFEEIEEFGKN